MNYKLRIKEHFKIFVFLFFCFFVFLSVLPSAAVSNPPITTETRGTIIPLPTGDCGPVKDNPDFACNLNTHYCQDGKSECEYTLYDFTVLFMNLAQFMLGLMGAIALASFIYGGFYWIFSGGDSGKIETGKKAIVAAVTGIVIIMGAWVTINFIVASLTGVEAKNITLFGQRWWEIKRK